MSAENIDPSSAHTKAHEGNFRHKQFMRAKQNHASIVQRFQKRVLVQKVLEEHQKKMELREKSEQYVQYQRLLEKIRNPAEIGVHTQGDAIVRELDDAKTFLEREREKRSRLEADEYQKLLDARRAAKKAQSRLAKYPQLQEKYVFIEESMPLPPPKPRPPRFPHTRRTSQQNDSTPAAAASHNATKPKTAKSHKKRTAQPKTSTNSPTPKPSANGTSRKVNPATKSKSADDKNHTPNKQITQQSPPKTKSPAPGTNVQSILDELAHEEAIYDDEDEISTPVQANEPELSNGDAAHDDSYHVEEDEEDVDKTNVDDVLNDILKEQQQQQTTAAIVQDLEASEMQALQLSSTRGALEKRASKAEVGAQLYSSVCEEVSSMGGSVVGNSQHFYTTDVQVDEINSYF